MARRDIARRRNMERRQRAEAEAAQRRAVDMRVIERAAVEAKSLTQQPEWDVYLQQVSALNDADRRALDALQTQVDTKEYMTPEEAQRAAFQRAQLRARIQARNECIEIPKRIQGAAHA